MTISRLALRSAAGFTAVSLGMLACAGLASADDRPNANAGVNAGISITGLNLGIGVGDANLVVSGGVSLGGNVGLGVGVDPIGVDANVGVDAGISLGISALDGAVQADAGLDLDADVDADVSLGDGIRKAAHAKIAERQAKAKVKAKPRAATDVPNVNIRPTAGLTITGLNLGAGVGDVKVAVVGDAGLTCSAAVGVGVKPISAAAGAECSPTVGVGVHVGDDDSRKSSPDQIRAKAKAKIAERAKR